MSLLNIYYRASTDGDGHPIDPYTAVAFERRMTIHEISCAVSAASVITFHDGADATAPEIGRFQSAGASTGHAFRPCMGAVPVRNKLWVEWVSGAGRVTIYSR